MREVAGGELEIVTPALSILPEPIVALVDEAATRHGTVATARAQLECLYSAQAQDLAGRQFYLRDPATPRSRSAIFSFLKPTPASMAGAEPALPPLSRAYFRRIAWRGHFRRDSVLSGLGLTLGITILYLTVIMLIPLSATILESAQFGWSDCWDAVTAPRVLAAYRVSFGSALIAALVNGVCELLVALILVRCRFPLRRLFDALVDLPFALPTAVAGIALTALYRRRAGQALRSPKGRARWPSRRPALSLCCSSSGCRLSYARYSRYSEYSTTA